MTEASWNKTQFEYEGDKSDTNREEAKFLAIHRRDLEISPVSKSLYPFRERMK